MRSHTLGFYLGFAFLVFIFYLHKVFDNVLEICTKIFATKQKLNIYIYYKSAYNYKQASAAHGWENYCNERGIFPHPKDCTSFITCHGPEKSEYKMATHRCPSGQAFSESDLRCTSLDEVIATQCQLNFYFNLKFRFQNASKKWTICTTPTPATPRAVVYRCIAQTARIWYFASSSATSIKTRSSKIARFQDPAHHSATRNQSPARLFSLLGATVLVLFALLQATSPIPTNAISTMSATTQHYMIHTGKNIYEKPPDKNIAQI